MTTSSRSDDAVVTLTNIEVWNVYGAKRVILEIYDASPKTCEAANRVGLIWLHRWPNAV